MGLRTAHPMSGKVEARQIDEARFVRLLEGYFIGMDVRRDIIPLVSHHIRAFADGYQEGKWLYFELSNGGFYMAPDSRPFRMTTQGSAEMSSDAAGILTCLFVLEVLGALNPIFSVHHEGLRTFVDQHPESERILARAGCSPAPTEHVPVEVAPRRPSPPGGSEP